MTTQHVPKFNELPIKPSAPPESSWGVFGDDDQLGCLNFLTAERIVAAAKLVRQGKVFRLDTPIGYADPPLFGRRPVEHTIVDWRPRGFLAFDDQLDAYNTQEGAQWDGLGHVGHMRYGFYNGTTAEQVAAKQRLGIHLWANRIVGRGVLIDVFSYRQRQGAPVNPGDSVAYSLMDLQSALHAENVELKPGDILLVRTGWLQHYRTLGQEARRHIADIRNLRACGLEPTRELAAWLWDNQIAALATDCPAVEPWPWDPQDEGALHYRTLALLGMPIGEQFDFEELAADCAEDGTYECMVVSAPLYLVGGIASPPNAVAIK
jgi:kynurenine formamidase